VIEYSTRAQALLSGLTGNLFVTINGNLGISQLQLQAGDVVAILYGAKVPYILREMKGGFFKFICEAFIDGIMYGNVLKEDREIINFKVY
jgi:hypothetical protein